MKLETYWRKTIAEKLWKPQSNISKKDFNDFIPLKTYRLKYKKKDWKVLESYYIEVKRPIYIKKSEVLEYLYKDSI